jgi:NUMOD4 motif/HNH endonuclease
MEEEIWKDVVGFEGHYKVSNLGRIMSKKDKIRKLRLNDGYWAVDLSIGPKRSNKLVHRLVAEAFIPNPENLPLVRHKDNCRTNSRVDNLQWGTSKDNMQDLSIFYKEAHQLKAEIVRLKNILKSLGYEDI